MFKFFKCNYILIFIVYNIFNENNFKALKSEKKSLHWVNFREFFYKKISLNIYIYIYIFYN